MKKRLISYQAEYDSGNGAWLPLCGEGTEMQARVAVREAGEKDGSCGLRIVRHERTFRLKPEMAPVLVSHLKEVVFERTEEC